MQSRTRLKKKTISSKSKTKFEKNGRNWKTVSCLFCTSPLLIAKTGFPHSHSTDIVVGSEKRAMNGLCD